MNKSPLVSVVVTCYNQAGFLDEALQSVLKQTYVHWECIIVNDGSKDDTEKIALQWCTKDSRFKYLHKENGGLSSARNYGLDLSTGAYIQFLDCDDLLDFNKLKLSIDCAQMNEYKIIISNYYLFQNNKGSENFLNSFEKNQLNFENVLYNWDNNFSIPIHCGFFTKELFDDFRFSINLKAKEDWIMWVLFFKRTTKIGHLNLPLAFYRKHAQSMTMTQDILKDYIIAYKNLEKSLTKNEFDQLSISLFEKYYKKSLRINGQLVQLKKSNTFQAGLFIKKVLKKLRVLGPSKRIFFYLRKIKKRI